MPTKPLYTTIDAIPQLQSILFTLPRELRDQVYHNILLTTRCTYQTFPSETIGPSPPSDRECTPDILLLQYRLPTVITNANPRNRPSEPSYEEPDWLFTCKAMMHEGLEQFSRNAEWYFRGYMWARRDMKHWTMRLPIDTSKVTRLELNVQNLANYEVPGREEGTDTRAALAQYAQRMRQVNVTWTTIRFAGHSYRFKPTNIYCDGQAANMMRNMVDIFDGIKVQHWEFSIRDSNRERYWVLYEWIVAQGKSPHEGKLDVMVKERTREQPTNMKPENDLANLLPPGWVCKRPPCECEECKLERLEGFTGGWERRPDLAPSHYSHWCGNNWL